MEANASRYRFGPFELRVRTRELYKQGTKLRLRPQPFHILKVLVERAGDVVTREELRNSVWPKETFVDFEHGLNTSVKELRGALSDSAREPRYIETLPKLGYRMIVPVAAEVIPAHNNGGAHALPAAGADRTLETRVTGQIVPEQFVPKQERDAFTRSTWPAWLGISLVLLAGVGGYFRWLRPRVRFQPANGRLMMAVLPFENLTGDARQEYLSDGLTEEMIAQIGYLDPQHLGVIARTSVMHYKNSHQPLERIGRDLAVQYVLEGSIRRDSDRVRISAQLIQMKDQTHIWARQYDRELTNLLAVQGEIAHDIAREIRIALNEPAHTGTINRASQPQNNSESYDLYLKGQYFWNKRTAQSLRQAIDYFLQATAKDPNSARAYAGLASAYALMSGYGLAPQDDFMPKARVAALRALEIDETLPEAHTALALIVQNYDRDWQTAQKEYQRAIELNPNYATGHHWYAQHLAKLGRFDEAFRESASARQLDPLSLIIAADNAAILYFSRQYDRAIDQCRAVLEMEPNFPRCHIGIVAYAAQGSYANALSDIEKWRQVEDTPWVWSWLAYVYGRSGEQAEAQRALKKLQQLNSHQQMDPAPILFAYIGMGDRDQAFVWLEKAYAQHSNALTTLKVDPIYDPLRTDPRFQELMRRVGLT